MIPPPPGWAGVAPLPCSLSPPGAYRCPLDPVGLCPVAGCSVEYPSKKKKNNPLIFGVGAMAVPPERGGVQPNPSRVFWGWDGRAECPPTHGGGSHGIPLSPWRGGTLPCASPILTLAEPLDPQSPTHQSLLLKRLGEYGGGAAMPLCVPSAPHSSPRAQPGHWPHPGAAGRGHEHGIGTPGGDLSHAQLSLSEPGVSPGAAGG